MGGKRKEREEVEGTESHGSTLFVSNIPYTATSTDLQTLFSDIAPVRSAFIVSDKETKKPKGVGYVAFAMKEDAELAFTTLGKGGTVLDGRVLRAEWAGKNNKEKKTGDVAEGPSPKKPRQVVYKTPTEQDKEAIRTIVISGLPDDLDSKPLWKKVRKYEGAESIMYPIEGIPNQAHAVFNTPAQAMRAVEKLHAHTFKGSSLSVILKKRRDTLLKPGKAGANTQKGNSGAAPNRNSRLIVRNLPWNITENNLRTIFLPYGAIHSVTLPTPTVEEASEQADAADDSPKKKRPKPKVKARGFAFVWFLSRKDAERAMEGANGVLVQGGDDGGVLKKGKGKDGENQKDTRTIAVDWALSKERWEAEKSKAEQDADVAEGTDESAAEDSGEDDEASGSQSGNESEDDESLSAEGVGLHDSEDEGTHDEDVSNSGGEEEAEEEEEEEEEVKKPTLPTPADGTTLFIRNVPFDATEEELRTLFKVHGPLRYARLTMDNSTTPPRPRGTAFVCFWKKEDAQSVLDLADSLRSTALGTSLGATSKKNPFTMNMPSLLTVDPSAGVARNLVLKGRTLDVARAVERGEAGKLLSEGVRKRRKEDKRNLYLLREGVITPSSPIAHTLSPADLSARVDSYNSRRNMLNSNPSLYVSKTRLSVRQLPRWATEGVLKRLAKHAISSFKKEMRDGGREGLTPEEMAVDEDTKAEEDTAAKEEEEEDGGKDSLAKKKKLRKRRLKDDPVVQSKIVRDSAKVDPLVGGPGKRVSGRSKGYAFLELALHADALRVLRWCNNNADAEKTMREFWKIELERALTASKAVKGKEKEKLSDTDAERVKSLKAKVKELEEEATKPFKPSPRHLIVEFSIENIQVVKRRSEKMKGVEQDRKQPIKRKSMLDRSFSRDEKDAGSRRDFKRLRPGKKDVDQAPRPSKAPRDPGAEDGDRSGRPFKTTKKGEEPKQKHRLSEAADNAKRKLGNSMGSLIGRKRKERREKR